MMGPSTESGTAASMITTGHIQVAVPGRAKDVVRQNCTVTD
jgi:hypothetical protein